MSDLISSSDEDFDVVINDSLLMDTELDGMESKDSLHSLDSRRRLENKIAERQLLKDIQEFDFDI